MLNADQALTMSLVSRVVPAAEVIQLVVELANQVAMNRPWAVRRTRVLLAATEELPVSQLRGRIDEVVAEVLAGLDARASLERRWPSAEA
jgi:enoyl-CoA hydratase/carnithine racemase